MTFSSSIKGIYYLHDVDLDHLAEVMFVRFFYCYYFCLTLPPFSYCTLWKEVTLHSPNLRNVDYSSPPLGLNIYIFSFNFSAQEIWLFITFVNTFNHLFILKFYLFLASLVLHCCMQTFSSCSEWVSHCGGFSCCRAWAVEHMDSAVVAQGLSCSAACGIFLDQGSNPCLLHCQADSLPLSHQGSPQPFIYTSDSWIFVLYFGL